MDALTQRIRDRLTFWEGELAAAALDNNEVRARFCEQIINEYTALDELTLGVGGRRPGLTETLSSS